MPALLNSFLAAKTSRSSNGPARSRAGLVPVAADDPTNCPARLDHKTEWSTSQLRADLKQRLIFLSGSVWSSLLHKTKLPGN